MKRLISIEHITVSVLLFFASICTAQNKEIPEYQKEAQQFVFSGNEELIEGNVLEGEKQYRKAIAKDPNNLEAAYNLGYSYYKTNNFEEAAMRSKEALKNTKTKAEKHAAYHNLGNAYLKMQKPDEAIEAYKNALRNNPTDEETRYNLAVAKKMKQQQDQNKDQNSDQNQENNDNKEGNENKENQDKKDSDEGEEDKDKENEKDEEGKEDENNEEENKDKEEKDKDKEGDKEDNKDEEQKQPPKPREGKLSPQQVESLLEAMAEEEKKVQDKMNEKKQGVRVNTDKDW